MASAAGAMARVSADAPGLRHKGFVQAVTLFGPESFEI